MVLFSLAGIKKGPAWDKDSMHGMVGGHSVQK